MFSTCSQIARVNGTEFFRATTYPVLEFARFLVRRQEILDADIDNQDEQTQAYGNMNFVANCCSGSCYSASRSIDRNYILPHDSIPIIVSNSRLSLSHAPNEPISSTPSEITSKQKKH